MRLRGIEIWPLRALKMIVIHVAEIVNGFEANSEKELGGAKV